MVFLGLLKWNFFSFFVLVVYRFGDQFISNKSSRIRHFFSFHLVLIVCCFPFHLRYHKNLQAAIKILTFCHSQKKWKSRYGICSIFPRFLLSFAASCLVFTIFWFDITLIPHRSQKPHQSSIYRFSDDGLRNMESKNNNSMFMYHGPTVNVSSRIVL